MYRCIIFQASKASDGWLVARTVAYLPFVPVVGMRINAMFPNSEVPTVVDGDEIMNVAFYMDEYTFRLALFNYFPRLAEATMAEIAGMYVGDWEFTYEPTPAPETEPADGSGDDAGRAESGGTGADHPESA